MMTLALMLQFVPTIPADPAAAPDPATVVSAIMDQVALAAAPQIHTAGFGLWREHVHLHPLWRDCGGAHAGVPRGQYRLDGRHCQRSPTEYEFPVA